MVLRVLVVLLCVAAGVTQGWAGGEDGRAAAKVHFKQGATAYAAGDYEKALIEYRQSYALLPIPDLLFNIAQALRMKGDKAEALAAYREYVAARPTGSAADQSRAFIEALSLDLEEAKARASAEAKARADAEARARAAAEETQRAEVARQAKAPAAAAPRPSRRGVWIGLGVGGGLLALGLGLGLGLGFGLSGGSFAATREPIPSAMGALRF